MLRTSVFINFLQTLNCKMFTKKIAPDGRENLIYKQCFFVFYSKLAP